MPANGNVLKMMTVDMGVDSLKPALSTMFGDNRKEYPPIYPNYMDVMNVKEFYVEFNQSGGFPDIPLLDEGDYINFSKPDLGDRVRLQPERRQLAFAITKLDRDYNKVDKVQRAMKRLARASRRTSERVAATPFNFGFDATFRPMPDGNPLFSNATTGGHVRLNGVVAYNRPATDVDLDTATLEDAILGFMNTLDQDGTPLNINPRFLLIHTSNMMNAKRILGSSTYFNQAPVNGNPRPSASFQGVTNVLQDFNLVIVQNPFLTDPDAWFLLGDKGETEIVFIQNEPVTDRSFEDPWTEDYIYSISFANIAGAVSDIATYGSRGA